MKGINKLFPAKDKGVYILTSKGRMGSKIIRYCNLIYCIRICNIYKYLLLVGYVVNDFANSDMYALVKKD